MFLERLLERGLPKRKKKEPSPYADYNTRIMASVLDIFCLMMLLQMVSPQLLLNPQIGAKIFTLLLMALLMAIIQHSMGTTVGKWLMGLKLVRADGISEVGFWRLCFRYLMCLISCACALLGMIWIMFDKKNRAWHDMAAGTVVLNLRPDGWYWGKIKQGYYRVRGRKPPLAVAADEAVTQPPTDER